MPSLHCIGLCLLYFLPSATWTDSYFPFCDFRQVDATGRYYLVIQFAGANRDNGGFQSPVNFTLVERKSGSLPVTNERDQPDFRKVISNPQVKVREGDTILAQGKLEDCPGTFVISSQGHGFAGLDLSGHNYPVWGGRVPALVIFSRKGVVQHQIKITQLLAGDHTSFESSAGGTWWCRTGWYDDQSKELIVVTRVRNKSQTRSDTLFKIVSLDTGKVRTGSWNEVLAVFKDRNAGAYEPALELVIEGKFKEVLPYLPQVYSQVLLPRSTRLNTAVALAMFGDNRGAELVKQFALEKSEVQYDAIRQLHIVMGDQAAPVLCDAVRKHGDNVSNIAWQTMRHISAKAAVPELIRLLDEQGPYKSQSFAMECLGDKGAAARKAVPSLIKVLERKNIEHHLLCSHEHAAIALGEIGADAKPALPLLIKLAEQHAPEEWEKVKNHTPQRHPDQFGGTKFSDDYIIDAICKIRAKK